MTKCFNEPVCKIGKHLYASVKHSLAINPQQYNFSGYVEEIKTQHFKLIQTVFRQGLSVYCVMNSPVQMCKNPSLRQVLPVVDVMQSDKKVFSLSSAFGFYQFLGIYQAL